MVLLCYNELAAWSAPRFHDVNYFLPLLAFHNTASLLLHILTSHTKLIREQEEKPWLLLDSIPITTKWLSN